jgi:hypothetical protein
LGLTDRQGGAHLGLEPSASRLTDRVPHAADVDRREDRGVRRVKASRVRRCGSTDEQAPRKRGARLGFIASFLKALVAALRARLLPSTPPGESAAPRDETGIKPDVRYLDRPEVRALLLAERHAFRTAICGWNEGAFLRVRETAQNGMAVLAAVRALEELEAPRDGRAVNVTVNTAVGLAPIRPGHMIRPPTCDQPSAPLLEHEPPPAGDADRH